MVCDVRQVVLRSVRIQLTSLLILVNNQLDAVFSMYLFISLLYMFRATQCSSTGESNLINISSGICRGADKSLARPGRKEDTATEDFDVHISYL